jgi:hypothetical protein
MSKRQSFDAAGGATAPRPRIIVEFLFDRGLLSIAVRNIGERPALKVAVTFEPQFTGMGGAKRVSAQGLFRNIEFLGPAREISTLLDHCAVYLARGEPARIIASVTYGDMEGVAFSDTMTHDLGIYRDVAYVDPRIEPGD